MATLSKPLCNGGLDIWYSPEPSDQLPPVVIIEGRRFSRFMDFIYLPNSTDMLSESQIEAVCRLRDRFWPILSSRKPNLLVKARLRAVAAKLSPHRLLELGPGVQPLFGETDLAFKDYILADLRLEVVKELRAQGYEAFQFSHTSKLPVEARSVDLILAAFVFQFPLTSHQLSELARVLAKDGLIVGNLYRRSIASQSRLREALWSSGFSVVEIKDWDATCRGNSYWVLAHSPVSNEALRKMEQILGKLEAGVSLDDFEGS